MLFEYYGKIIIQSHRDLFKKARSLRVSQSSAAGFMTQVEADAAMESAKQAELISVHANRLALPGKPPFNNKASLQQQEVQGQRRWQRRRSQRSSPLSPPSAAAAAAGVAAAEAASPSAPPAGSPHEQQSTLPRANRDKGGKDGKGTGQ